MLPKSLSRPGAAARKEGKKQQQQQQQGGGPAMRAGVSKALLRVAR